MPRKIYDIIPNEDVEEIKVFHSTKKSSKRKKPFMLLLFVVVVLLGLFFFVGSKAKVVIYPNTEEISTDASITVETSRASTDFENLVLRGVIFSDSRKVSESYPSTGTSSKTKKATGTIRVYNKIDPPKDQALVKNTRFLSVPGGLIYRANEAFTIPANGYIDIEVTADEPGTEYNLDSATFSVPGLSKTEIYSSIYAETVTSLDGGEKAEVKVVTDEDLSLSKTDFEKKYKEIIKNELIASLSEDFIYVPDSMSIEIMDLYSDAPVGTETEEFNLSANIDSKILVFRKDDLVEIGEKLIKEELADRVEIVPGSITYEIKEYANVEGKTKLNVTFTAKTYTLPEEELLRASLLNRDQLHSKSLLENMVEIKKVEIDISPFWRSSLPTKEDDVEIELRYD